MKNSTKIGSFALTALALAISSSAQAAGVPTGMITGGAQANPNGALGTSLGFNLGVSGVSGLANVVYNPAAGGNQGTVAGMGPAAGPFAPASSINITNSRHNLGSGNTIDSNHTAAVLASNSASTNNAVVGTNQICVFCHTPHGFNTVQSGPLWNKHVNASSTYTVYNAGTNNSDTLDANAPVIGSVSLACLSCHDGTQAMDNMVNAPGSGGMATGYDATKASSVGNQNLGVTQGYVWGTPPGGNGFALMSQGGNGLSGMPANGDQPALEGIDLGTDLSNDHPISVQYCGGGISTSGQGTSTVAQGATYAAGTCNDRLFNLPTTAFVNGQSRFWVDTNVIPDADAIAAHAASTGGVTANPITRDPNTTEIYVGTGETIRTTGNNGDAGGRGFIPSTATNSIAHVPGFGVRTKQDIMLFTNNAGVSGPSVECASCHDPHTPNNGTFLRVSNNGSGLCLSCHVK